MRRSRVLLLAAGLLALGLSVAISAFFWRTGAERLYVGQITRIGLPLVLLAVGLSGRRWAAWGLAVLCALWAVGFGVPAIGPALRGVTGAYPWVGAALGYVVAALVAVASARTEKASSAAEPPDAR